MIKIYIYIAASMVFLAGCVSEPVSPLKGDHITGSNGVFVLCEGLWGSDNSTLERIDLATGAISNSYFQASNAGLRLGDIASDIAIKGDTVFVSVGTSSTIEVFSKIDGKSFGRIFLPENSQPRKIVIVNDSTAYVTLLYKESIAKFNPTTLTLSNAQIKVGPFPEGIAYLNGKLFVANSGYGDYYHTKPKAGTISVVDVNSGVETQNMVCGKNPIELIAGARNGRIYAAYYNLPSLRDSLGGIVEYDANSLAILRHWRLRATDITLSAKQDTLFFLKGNTDGIDGVYFIDLKEQNPIAEEYIKNENSDEIWYSLTQSPDQSTIWVGNAKRFQTVGGLLLFPNKKNSTEKRRYQVGVNPNKILFF